ncbi:MAG: universal stress protein [Thermoleophilia bacterium]
MATNTTAGPVIVVATDGSCGSVEAVEVGVDIGAHESGSLVFVRVLPEPAAASAAEEPALAAAAASARLRGVPFAVELRSGDPAAEIVSLADERRADLVVVGSRGLSRRADGSVIGSVSRAVMRQCPRPVLVARGSRER